MEKRSAWHRERPGGPLCPQGAGPRQEQTWPHRESVVTVRGAGSEHRMEGPAEMGEVARAVAGKEEKAAARSRGAGNREPIPHAESPSEALVLGQECGSLRNRRGGHRL